MPQMAPYNWLYLNIMFTMILIMYLSYLYYLPMHNPIKISSPLNLKISFKFMW